MDKFQKIVLLVAKGNDWIARGALIALAVFIIANVLGRLLRHPIMGGYEIIGLLTGIVVAFSIAYCQVQKGHVFITVATERLPQRTQAIIGAITAIISALLFMVLSWQCWDWGIEAWGLNRKLGVSPVPLAPFIFAVGFTSFVLSLVLVVDTHRAILKAAKK